MEVVINACFGGFGLSEAGVRRYAEIKGLPLWVEAPTGELGEALVRMGCMNYWLVPPGPERPRELPNWHEASMAERQANNKAREAAQIYPRDIPRDDPALVQAVEELGEAANGRCADLRAVEIPDGVEWQIEEYDGNEHIAEQHRTWHA